MPPPTITDCPREALKGSSVVVEIEVTCAGASAQVTVEGHPLSSQLNCSTSPCTVTFTANGAVGDLITVVITDANGDTDSCSIRIVGP